MNLVIHAHTLKNEPLSLPITGRFDVRGGTIGRSDTNTMSLPDPERHISRLHAEVWFSNGSFSIRNVGSANPIMLNGRAIVPGEGATLAEADEIVIGTYAMRVTLEPPVAEKPLDPRTVITLAPTPALAPADRPAFAPFAAASESVPPAPTPLPPGDVFANLPKAAPPIRPPASVAADNPFGDLLQSSVPTGAPPSANAGNDPFANLFAPPAPAASLAPAAVPTPPRLPDDFDPFAAPPPNPAAEAPSSEKSTVPAGLDPFSAPPPPKKPTPAQISAFSDLLGDAAAPPASALDDAFGLGKAAKPGEDPLANFLAPSAQGKPAAPGLPSTDPMAMFGGASDTPAFPEGASLHDHDRSHSLNRPFQPLSAAPSAEQASGPAPSKPWYARFSSATAAPVSPKGAGPQDPPPAATGPEAQPPARPARGIMQSERLVPDSTTPHVRVPRPEHFSFEAPNKPMPPIPQRDGSLSPAPPPAGVAMPTPAAARPPADVDGIPPTAPAQAPSPQALWAAFCEGAGISMPLPQGLNPDLMRILGQILHHSVEGTLKLVAVRAAAKQELRAQVTTIQSRNNNPLKFSPDAATAIEQLLQPPARGFMVGPAAVNDAMDDLLGHAIGTMAGMRAALAGVLQRFEPARLEGKLSGQSVIDSLLPMNRRAKLWELYLQHYDRIQNEAQEDFHELYGKAFIRAYEDQLNRLDNDRRSPPQP